jgi:hypothetical protein
MIGRGQYTMWIATQRNEGWRLRWRGPVTHQGVGYILV